MKRSLPLFVLVSVALLGGCGSCFGPDVAGNSEDGWFAIGPRHDIAVGTVLDIVVLDAHSGNQILTETDLQGVTSENTAIVDVEGFSGNGMELRGVSEGRSWISFSGIADEERRDDRTFYSAVEPEAFTMTPGCGDGNVVRGRPAAIPFFFSPTSRGRGLYPVSFDPPDAATVNLELSTANHMVIDVAIDAPERFVIAADPDSPMTVTPQTFNVFDEAEVLSMNLSTLARIQTDRPDPGNYIDATATIEGGTEVCTIYPVELTTLGACGVWFDGKVSESATGYWTQIGLVALSRGSCLIQMFLTIFDFRVVAQSSTEVLVPDPPTSSGGFGSGGGGDSD